MNDIVTAIALVSGGLFAFIAALGLIRMPDVYIRMHAATKAGTLGVGLVMAAVAVHFAEAGIAVRALAGIVFLVITAPVAAHLIGRAAYRAGVAMWSGTITDEWGDRPEVAPAPARAGRSQPISREG